MGFQNNLFVVAATALSLGSTPVSAADPPTGGNVGLCHSQSCGDCPVYASASNGYPNCNIYTSRGNIDDYANPSGQGYDVWWNSGPPNAGCQIIVRTPASQDISDCGYYERGWKDAGCYYTLVRSSFMLQYCCGTGDCSAAAPAASIAEVHAMQLQGVEGVTSLMIHNMTSDAERDSGKRDLGNGITANWAKRSPSGMTQLAKRDCKQYGETGRYTKAGRQQRVSPTQDCNDSNGCSLMVGGSITTGRTESVNAGFNLFELFQASTGIEFTQQKTRTVSSTYSQAPGTSGYVTFTPTYICTEGNVNECSNANVNNGDFVSGCTPQLIGSGDQEMNSGTYSFVYE